MTTSIKIPFVGGAYAGKSSFINDQVCKNMFIEVDQNDGKTPKALVAAPGLTQFSTIEAAEWITVAIADNADDTNLLGNGSFSAAWTENVFGVYTNILYLSAISLRFANVVVAKNNPIWNAFIRVTSQATQSKAVVAKVCFNESDNAVAPVDAATFQALSLDAGVSWTPAASWVADTTYDTSELRTLVQEIVNRAGWASGQAMQAVIKDNGTGVINTQKSIWAKDAGTSKEPVLWINKGSLPIRGMHAIGSTLYAVIGTKLWSITTAGAKTEKGTLDTASGPVYFADNGAKLMLVDGNSGYTVVAGTFAKITDADFPAAPTSVTWQDGYYIVSRASSGIFNISDFNDPTAWDALDYASAEGSPDNLLRVLSVHRDLWLIGDRSVEVWYNSGDTFPFTRMQGAFIEGGTCAKGSAAIADNTLFWLTDNRQIVRAEGYRKLVVSTPQIDWQIAQYTTVSDAFGFSYIQEGHEFYVLVFPTESETWVYDISTGIWHQRTSYNPGTETYGRWRANAYCLFNNKPYVGDYDNGKIYLLDPDAYDDDGYRIERVRRAPIVFSGNKGNIFHGELELDCEAGVGLSSGDAADTAPQITLKWSDDGGNTFTSGVDAPLGAAAAYTQRTRYRRLGKSLSRIYEISTTAKVKIIILDAYLLAEQ